MSAKKDSKDDAVEKPVCFVIMPIADHPDYDKGHFKRVYEDIFVPACEKAGYQAIRADNVKSTNMIHLDILKKILESPVAICDLSSRNPNVLFELGLRQAFDKPVILVQEEGTPAIFDIAPLRYTTYRKARLYHEVLVDQDSIASAIKETVEEHTNKAGINSLVKLLSLTKPASLVEVANADQDPNIQIIRAEISELKNEIRSITRGGNTGTSQAIQSPDSYGILVGEFADSLKNLREQLDKALFDKDVDQLRFIEVRLGRLNTNMRRYEGVHLPAVHQQSIFDLRRDILSLRRNIEAALDNIRYEQTLNSSQQP